MSAPLVSVIILTYNHKEYIRSAIECCLMQRTSFPFEIIIHDDASTDGTTSIVMEYADKYPDQIIPIIQRENQYQKGVLGGIRMEKFILPLVRGKYIAYCEGDDYWINPNKLEKQVAVMEKDPSISMCFTAVKVEYDDITRNDYEKRYYKNSRYCEPKDVILKGGNFSDVVTTVTRRDIYENPPGWFFKSPVGDIALSLLAMTRGKIYYLDFVTAVYRKGVSGSWTQRSNANIDSRKDHIESLIRFRDEFDRQTGFLYHDFVDIKIKSTIRNFLISYKDFNETDSLLFQRLSRKDKIKVYLFRNFSPIRLWSINMRLRRYLKGY